MNAGVRLVLDTNIVISAMLWHGTPHDLMVEARAKSAQLFTTPPLLAELADILTRPNLAVAVTASGASPDELMRQYARLAIVISAASISPTVHADPDDDQVLACAAAARADYIVSGDTALLTIEKFHDIPIVTAKAMIPLLSGSYQR